MQIDGKQVPQSVVDFWVAGLDDLTREQVRALAGRRRSVSQGFRPSSLNVQVARERLKAEFLKSAEVPADIRIDLQNSSLSRSLLIVFSTVALVQLSSALAEFFGRIAISAALLLDDREEVRQLAWPILEAEDSGRKALEKSESALEISDTISPFLSNLAEILSHDPDNNFINANRKNFEDDQTGVTEKPLQRKRRLKSEAELVLNLRNERKERTRIAREHKAILIDFEKIRGQLEREVSQSSKLKNEVDSSHKELTELKNEFDNRLSVAIQHRLDDRLLPWLRPSEALARNLGIPTPHISAEVLINLAQDQLFSSSAIQDAKKLLEKQRITDLKYGLRTALQLERNECSSLIANIKEAQLNSLRPLEELQNSLQMLRDRVKEITTILDDHELQSAAENIVLEKIRLKLSQVNTIDELSEIRRQIINISSVDLLDDSDLEQIFSTLNEATGLIYARTAAEQNWELDHQTLSGAPLYALQTALIHHKPSTLIVDGHNILWKLPRLFKEHFENGVPGPRARKTLEAYLASLTKRYSHLTVHLWFDSDEVQEYAVSDMMRVHFSGGSGANRADKQIIAYLNHIQTSNPSYNRFVATADTDVQLQAQEYSAPTIAPEELGLLMR